MKRRLCVLTEDQYRQLGHAISNWADDSDEMRRRLGKRGADNLFAGHAVFGQAERIPDESVVLVLTEGEMDIARHCVDLMLRNGEFNDMPGIRRKAHAFLSKVDRQVPKSG